MEIVSEILWFGMKAMIGFGILVIYLLCVDWANQYFRQK